MADNKLVLEGKHLRGEDGSKIISVRMKEELLSRMEEVAEKTGRSRNELFSIFVRYALENCVIKEK